jgi:hypothetical protein
MMINQRLGESSRESRFSHLILNCCLLDIEHFFNRRQIFQPADIHPSQGQDPEPSPLL